MHIAFIVLLFSATASAQYKIKGAVYDSSRIYPIPGVTVLSTGGQIAMTDSNGHYEIAVAEKDSIWFSFLGKPTPKYPVIKIADVNQFNLSLRLKMNVLKEVVVRTRSYVNDSIENRRAYAKVFDWQKPGLSTMTSVGPMGAGIDVNELIRLFQFRRNKSILKFQERLELEEREKFVDRKFNRLLVKSLTGLDGIDLTEFMQQYRPTFEFAAGASDYDFRYFIRIAAEQYKKSKVVRNKD